MLKRLVARCLKALHKMTEAEKCKRVAWDGRLVCPLRARVPYDKAAVIRRTQLRLREPAPLREEAGELCEGKGREPIRGASVGPEEIHTALCDTMHD